MFCMYVHVSLRGMHTQYKGQSSTANVVTDLEDALSWNICVRCESGSSATLDGTFAGFEMLEQEQLFWL